MTKNTKTTKKNRKYQPSMRPKVKEKLPMVDKDKSGFFCPFCIETHPIYIERESACGTMLKLTAIQTTYRSKAVTCTVCGETGGQLVKIADGYRHATNCAPGVTYYDAESSKAKTNSVTAGLFHTYAPDKLTLWWAKRFGRTAEELRKVDQHGKISDEIVGYAWKRVNYA